MARMKSKASRIILIVAGILFLAIFSVSARPQTDQSPTYRAGAKKPLIVLNKDQPDSPIIITAAVVDDFPDPRMPAVHFNVINNSGKPIMVYAIKHEAALGNRGSISGVIIVNSADNERALRPGKAPQVEISGIQYPQPPETMTLSVDFVEFVDGTRWGEDTFKNGERIDGVRAGANAQREALLNVLTTDGPEELIRSLDLVMPDSYQSSSRSAEWLDGFRHGVGWIRARVRAKGQNFSEVEKVLRHMVDPTRDRR